MAWNNETAGSHYILPNERMAFIEQIKYLEGVIKGKDEQLRKKDEQNGAIVKDLVNVHIEKNESNKKLKEVTEKLAEKEATIVALKENINFKKLVFFTISCILSSFLSTVIVNYFFNLYFVVNKNVLVNLDFLERFTL